MNPTAEAIDHITNCCPHIGAFSATSDVYCFLKRVALDISSSKGSVVFPSRYFEHVAYAVDMIASNDVMSPPAAIASVYLNTRFEFYFRILSGKLNAEGKWTSPEAKNIAKDALKMEKLGNQISNVAQAYKIMKIDQSLSLSKHCTELDNVLYSSPGTVSEIKDIGDRIKWCRDRVAHGHWGDISSEGIFYGLLTALVFYNQS